MAELLIFTRGTIIRDKRLVMMRAVRDGCCNIYGIHTTSYVCMFHTPCYFSFVPPAEKTTNVIFLFMQDKYQTLYGIICLDDD